MTDAKRLLAEATPLPWRVVGHTTDQGVWLFGESHWQVRSDAADDPERGPHITTSGMQSEADAILAAYAVNHLPDYLAAVDALERILDKLDAVYGKRTGFGAVELRPQARAALARLRDEVPA